ncbi:BTB-domain-containing protein [Rhizophagus irregularis]|uniref:BTB-domain-containing protein n=1 Tax=Rhizophagus irregularis TaxID=588596 RepID=A0A2N1NCP2_9GLOM|nr:BTB-domain-containing protein [Rhizophagus irregularis]
MTSIFHSNLSKDLSLILNNSDDYNVIIQVGKNQNVKEFQAHSVILRARSPYFKSAFSNKWATKKNNMIMFTKPNITPRIFETILKYIYTGELDLTKQLCEDILELLIASDELLLEELVEYLQEYLIQQQKNWVQQNSVFILNKFASYKKLQDYCLESACEDSQPFITSKNSLLLDKDFLYSILERNDLQIKEIDAWNYLIKWGIEQTPGLESENNDVSKWTNENYKNLEKTLRQFIPLIRFTEISPIDFFVKVRPYKDIIPNHIYDEVEDFYYKGIIPETINLPHRVGKIESKIIKSKHANIIINWINKKGLRTINDPHYEFKLIYRGSDDGINNNSFKNKCKGQIASLVVIKVQGSEKIFGGYSSIGFNSIGNLLLIKNNKGWPSYYSLNNFIFSFENIKDTHNMKISRVINSSKAILDYYDNGFNFGQGSLCMKYQNLYVNNRNGIYENNLNTDIVYTIEEIETFNVIRCK